MNILNKRRSGYYQLKPVAAGCAILLSAMTTSAFAQQADVVPVPADTTKTVAKTDEAPGTQTVVVSGIRRGIEAAISIKKNSSSIVEAISAEDIGKLPDSSVAESIARLPGVTTQRSRGTGKPSEISVRGLAPSFNGTLVNGREQASTGNSRSPEFDLFPAELIGSAVIYKTPDASVIGQGLAATIDLRTVQPLDFGKRVVAVSARKERTGINTPSPEGSGHRYSFSYIDQFANRTIGVAVGLTTYKSVGGGQQKFEGGGTGKSDYNGQSVTTPSGFKADTETSTYDRKAASLALQYRPNRDFKTTLDVVHSEGSSALKKTGLEGSISGSWGGYDPQGMLTNATIANGVATSGTFTGYKGDVRNHMESADDKLTSIGWNSSLDAGGWKLGSDLSSSKATKKAQRFETLAGQAGNTPAGQVSSISWTGFNGSDLSAMKLSTSHDFSNRATTFLTDTTGWGGGPQSPQAGYVAYPTVDDKILSLRLTGRKEIEWGVVNAVSVGFNSTKRDKERVGAEGRLAVIGAGGGYATATVPGTAIATAGTTGIPIVSFDPTGTVGSIYELARWVDATTLAKDWSVSEKVNTMYAMADMDGKLGSLPYKGNVGLQVVRTTQSTVGNKVDLATCKGITEATCPSSKIHNGTSYTDFLPSANVTFDLGRDQVIRVAAAKVLARANLDDMRASSSFGVDTTDNKMPILSGSGGNAKLEPFRAKALDVSYEKYFGKKGYISAAVFYKKLDTYILRSPRAFDFGSQVSANTPLPQSGPFKGSTVGVLTTPTNGDGGNIRGVEVAVNVPFSLFTPYLDGFGASLNHSDTTSGIDLPAVGFATINVSPIRIPLPGLSKRVSNLRLYYEKAGFQFAWAARKRSDFLGAISDYQDNSQLTFVKGETVIDLQASYEVQAGPLKGVSVFATANNWNNTPYQEYNGVDRNAPSYKTTYGRTYQFGASYKF
ncbi:TonB-dependent receptor [Massilia sp. TSP1-1-2]|uniref:TonB-dependent receptor n=1 Tax=unclassified Massilia TaxID=2609279 RepID=UPI003CF1CDCC